jgi:putative ABC transport system substrate-binding protein
MGPDVLVATSTPTARTLRDLTRTIPIVFVGLSDPVTTGIVSHLAHPEGTVTGLRSTSTAWPGNGWRC